MDNPSQPTAKSRTSHKLTHGEQRFILQSLAEDHSYSYITVLVKEHFNKDISRSSVYQYAKRYEAEIDGIREKINADFAGVPISNKIVRQRRREHIYQLYLKSGHLKEALSVLDDVEKLESPVPAPNSPGIHIGINNSNSVNVLNELSDQELDGLARGIIQKRQAVNN